MKFDDAILENAQKHLKKIRIKVDPLYTSYENFKDINYYEGYVLEESEESIKIMVIKAGLPIIDVPQDAFKKATSLEKFKTFILDFLRISDENAWFHNIQQADTFEDIEESCCDNGCKLTEILNLYREFLKQNEQL